MRLTRISLPEALRVSAGDPSPGRLPLQVRFTARDAATGADLAGAAQLLVNRRGRWVPLADLPEDLTTGGSWRFRVAAPGYDPVDYFLVVKPSQAALYLEARMERRHP